MSAPSHSKTLIIAEAGVNHNGDEQLAFEMIDAACEAKADIVKFQVFNASQLVTHSADMADYQRDNTGTNQSQLQMLQALELKQETFKALRDYCQKKQIRFLATAFDEYSLRFLVEELQVDLLKLPSGELTNGPLVHAHGKTGLDIIMSTGMANLTEIQEALTLLALGYSKPQLTDLGGPASWSDIAGEDAWREVAKKVTLLHCISQYPAPFEQVNLRAMATLKQQFRLPVGLSDHTMGIHIPVAAVALGARVIEKHFTLSHDLQGPDHKASLEPDALIKMVQAIRDTEAALGQAEKSMQDSEVEVAKIARRSLVAAMDISRGEVFSASNLTTKRPGTGVSPNFFWQYLGKTATRAYRKDELIDE